MIEEQLFVEVLPLGVLPDGVDGLPGYDETVVVGEEGRRRVVVTRIPQRVWNHRRRRLDVVSLDCKQNGNITPETGVMCQCRRHAVATRVAV